MLEQVENYLRVTGTDMSYVDIGHKQVDNPTLYWMSDSFNTYTKTPEEAGISEWYDENDYSTFTHDVFEGDLPVPEACIMFRGRWCSRTKRLSVVRNDQHRFDENEVERCLRVTFPDVKMIFWF